MKKNAPIPFLDLVAPHEELKEELTGVFRTALETGMFVGGRMVEAFERDFAAFCGVEHCIGVASGTDALRFALIAAGIKPGDVVITVPNTFIATAEAISQAGARPEFVDVNERTLNMDPALLEEYLETKCAPGGDSGPPIHRESGRPVTAVVPVHLYGQPADMDPILDVAARYGLIAIEDACQAQGAEYFSRREQRWKRAGSMGKAAAFSFYPGKNLGACGEAGAVTTNDAAVAETIRMLRDHGQSRKYYHELEGYNGRLDAIQAGILQVKLRMLPKWNEQRRKHAAFYRSVLTQFADIIDLPTEASWRRGVYHLYVVRHAARQALQDHLAAANVGTAIHYPVPLHRQNAYKGLGYKRGAFPVTESAAEQILSLPMFPQLRPEQQQRVAAAIAKFVTEQKPTSGRIAAAN
jgi:dTDP-4-amino-4,6-dideoxygalactose transaminase